MIVRILGEGQYELPANYHDHLAELDEELAKAIEANDEAAFSATLDALIHEIKSAGTPVELDRFIPSNMILPSLDTPLFEVKELLDEGTIGEQG